MKKLLLFLLFFSFFIYPQKIFAQQEFATDVDQLVEINPNSEARVINTITIENLTSQIHATSYIFNVGEQEPIDLESYENENPLNVTKKNENGKFVIRIDFTNFSPGIGKKKEFKLIYKINDIVIKTGDV